MKKYKFVFLNLLLSVLFFLMIGSGLLPQFLLQGLQTHDYLTLPSWKEKNAIVLLGGGIVKWAEQSHYSPHTLSYSRLFEATRLFLDCKKKSIFCRILISGGDPAGHGIAEATALKAELMKTGISQDEILTETKSLNTFQNASFSSLILREHSFDRIILVTSGSHMSRALVFFSNFGIEAVPAPADNLSVSNTWKYFYTNFFITDLALHEYAGQLKFLVSK